MLDAPPGAGPLEALLGNVAMSAFDLARADWRPVGQSLAVVQVVGASAEIAVAGSHGRMLVVDFGRLATSGKRPQNGVETPAFERLLLRLHPGAPRRRVGRDRFGSRGQVFANVDKNQSNSGPGGRIAPRLDPRSRARRRRPREPGSSPRSLREPRRKAADARPLRPRPRSSPHKPASGSLERAPSDSFASRQDNVLPLRLSFPSQLGSTIGTMPPSVSTTIGLRRPGASGNSEPSRPASSMAWAWANVIRWIVLSPIAKP